MKLLLAALSLLFPSFVISQVKPISVLPFMLENNGIYIYCQVNETDSLKFLFDTGANVTVINAQSAHKTHLKIDAQTENMGSNGTNTVSQSNGNRVRYGNITAEKVPLSIIPYGTDAFDGVFGTNLMKDYVIEIDYQKKELRFYEPKKYNNKLASYSKLKIRDVNDYPCIEAALIVNGKKHKGYFGLDTGADNLLTVSSPFVKKHSVGKTLAIVGKATSQGSDGSVYQSPVVLMPEIKIGKKSFYALPVELSQSTEGTDASEERAGYWGNNFLKRFDAVLDLQKGYFYLKPNGLLYTPVF